MKQTIDTGIAEIAQKLMQSARKLVTAESCTGGMIAAACTDLAGSSQWFERGFVTYSNEAKIEALGVDRSTVTAHGAASEAVVRAMALGAIAHAQAQVAVAVTGVAGPTGGSRSKPVGTVWFGFVVGGVCSTECQLFDGDRAAVRAATVAHAVRRLQDML
jgi:nicotinamide-nucleotide amidase